MERAGAFSAVGNTGEGTFLEDFLSDFVSLIYYTQVHEHIVGAGIARIKLTNHRDNIINVNKIIADENPEIMDGSHHRVHGRGIKMCVLID